MTFEEQAQDFLAQERIAIAGLSRSGDAVGNGIFRAFRDRGYNVVPVHPEATTLEDVTCYPNLQAIPGGVDAVFIATPPEASAQVMRDAVEAGATHAWMHYNAMFGESLTSVSPEAVAYGRENRLTVIDGGCPMMFFDFGHKCMKWMLGVMGKLPQPV